MASRSRPQADASWFVAAGTRVVSAIDVARALGPPMRARVEVENGTGGEWSVVSVQVEGEEWVRVVNVHHETSPGYEVSVVRKAASDEDWRRAQSLPSVLDATKVTSAGDFEGTAAEWMAAIADA